MKKFALLLFALATCMMGFAQNTDEEVYALDADYAATQVGSSYIAGNYTSWVDYNYAFNSHAYAGNNTLSLTVRAMSGYYYIIIGGIVDTNAKTITFPPQENISWATLGAKTAATDSIRAKYSIANDSITISFEPFSTWYYGYAYENCTSLVMKAPYVKKTQEWASDAKITYTSTKDSVLYSNVCQIASWSGFDYTYTITNFDKPRGYDSQKNAEFVTPAGLDFTKMESTGDTTFYTIKHNFYGENSNYFYYVLSDDDDIWYEGGDKVNKTYIEGNETKGSLKFYYWRYIYNKSTKTWSDDTEGWVTVEWPYVEPTAIGDVNTTKTSSVRKVMENGQIVIYNGDAKYNVMGARIR